VMLRSDLICDPKPVMVSLVVRFLIVAAIMVVVGCSSSTAPDSRVVPAVGPPWNMRLEPCDYEPQVATCPVLAKWGDLYSTYQDVTTVAEWSSSAPNVVQVIGPGRLLAGTPGDAEVTVAYRGVILRETFRAYVGEPPWWVCLRCEQIWSVTDFAGRRLEGVFVEIVAGHEIGSHATSDQFGRVVFHGLPCGPVTARATKEGYREWIASATLCGRGGNGQPGSESLPPIRLTPQGS
jgi:hypothetical protein